MNSMKKQKMGFASIPRKFAAIAILVLGLTVSGLIVSTASWAADATPNVSDSNGFTKKDIESIIRDYILNHPEVILESVDKLGQKQQQAEQQQQLSAAQKVKPITSADHIMGNPDAPVKVIEFSDLECPFCKRFQQTLKQLMDVYGKDGRVAWVFRHFPIDSLHSKARKEAQASECANELGGNKAFWAFIDKVFEVTPSNNHLDLSLLPQIAQEIGLDRRKFETCLQGDARGGKYAAHIEANVQDATAAGGNGTPYTIVLGSNGETFPISGAQPYEAVRAIIDVALKGK